MIIRIIIFTKSIDRILMSIRILCGLVTWITAFLSFGQTLIEGRVLSQKTPIPGATIQVLGTDQGTISDEDGYFQLAIQDGVTYAIEVRSMGFKVSSHKVTAMGMPVFLEVALQESLLSMEEVVVTGTMNPTFVSQSPVKIEVITAEYLNNFTPAAATSIVEGISLINGIQEVVACGVCFTNSISINGLPGPYTAILMDGSPIYGNLASVYGLNGIPSMIIDRFEVIKGPSSTLYGSEAVAGVINIITKDPASQPLISADIMGTTHLESFGNFSIAPHIGKSNGFIGLNYAYINNFDDENGDGFGDNINLDRISIFSKWNIYRPSGKKFTLTGKYYYEDRRNGVEQFLTDKNYRRLRGSAEVYGESIFTNRFELFGSYEFPVAASIKLDYSLSTHKQNSFYGADFYDASQDIVFTNLIWSNQTGNHDLSGGFTSRFQAYDDNTIATERSGINTPDNQYIPGLFLQDEWSITNRFTALGGARLDHYQQHGLIFSPRLNLKFKPAEWTTIRSNFGTGFRIVNLFTEDHAFVTGQREVVINEELKPEESFNYSINLNHVYTLGASQGMLDVDAFYTYFTNKITPDYETTGQINYANADGYAVSKGIGLSLQHEFVFPLAFNLGINIQEVTENENGEIRDIEFAPSWSGVGTVNYRLKKWKTNIGYTVNLTGSMALPQVFDLDENGAPETNARPTISESFAIHNIQFSKEPKAGFSVYCGIQNLFDLRQSWSPLVGFNDPNANTGFSNSFDTSYAYAPIHGREFYLGVSINLNR